MLRKDKSMKISDIDYEYKKELRQMLFIRDSGILERDLHLKSEWEWAWDSQDFEVWRDFLDENSGLLVQAERIAIEEQAALEKCPYLPRPQGPEIELINGEICVGWVNNDKDTFGIDEKDFTEIVFICGRTGCGKSNVIRLIASQFLHNNGE